METKHKELIVKELKKLSTKLSGKKVANKAQVSSATISQMINGNWDLIRDEMWHKVKVNLSIDWGWRIAQTSNLVLVNNLLQAAQQGSLSISISFKPGTGKSTGFEFYERLNKNVILIECKNYWSKKSFARHQLIACGLDDYGTTEEMIERFVKYLSSLDHPLVIYDQFDKLKEPHKDLFMDYYNELDGHCGFVLSGVEAFKVMEEKGIRKNKMGYRERYSRYGSRFIKLNNFTQEDTRRICAANGVDDADVVSEIHNVSLGDGRRIKREVERYFLQQSELKSA